MRPSAWLIAMLLLACTTVRSEDKKSHDLCQKNFSNYKERLSKNPEDDLTWTELRVCAGELKKWDEAIQIALQARNKNRNLPQPYLILGMAQMQQKNYDRAIEHFDQSIGLRSAQPLAYFQMGMAYLFMNEPIKAAQAAERAIELDSTNSAYHRQLAYTRLLLKDYEGGEASAREAIRLDPDDLAAHKILAKVYGKAGKTAEMQAELSYIQTTEAAALAAHPELAKKPEPVKPKRSEESDDEDEENDGKEDYQLIGLCIGQWNRMKDAIMHEQVDQALTYYSDYLDTREQYRASFKKMGNQRLKSVFSSFGELYDCEIVFATAHCKSMVRSPSGGVSVAKIRFEKNPDKVWRIRSF